MDTFDSKDFYGHSLSDNSQLRATTRNYEFKFNSSIRLDTAVDRAKIIRKRPKQKNLLLKDFFSDITKPSFPRSKQQHPKVFKLKNVETQIGKLNTKKKMISVMSDKDIESMMLVIGDNISNGANVSKESNSSTSIKLSESKTLDVQTNEEVPHITTETKNPKLFVAVELAIEPQWAEIIPHPMATVTRRDTMESNWDEESFNFNEIEENNEDDLENKFSDVLSFESNLTDYFVMTDDEPPERKKSELPLNTPTFFGNGGGDMFYNPFLNF